MGTITFRHQDGDLAFRVAEATFDVSSDRRLTLSIRCEGKSEYPWMAEPLFCLVDIPLASPLAAGSVVLFTGDGEDFDPDPGEPRAHVYVGIHDMPRDVELRFTRVTDHECDIEISWVQGDVNYYGHRAKDTRAVGRCTLTRGPISDMWIPA